MNKHIVIITLGFLFLLCFAPFVNASPSYYIDTIYDTNDSTQSNWLETVPTLIGGETYSLTMEARGVMNNASPDDIAHFELDIDWNDDNALELVFNELSDPGIWDVPNNTIYYWLTTDITVPDTVLDSNVIATASLFARNETSSLVLVDGPRLFNLNLKSPSSAVPEPASMLLFAIGVLPMAGSAIKLRKKKLSNIPV